MRTRSKGLRGLVAIAAASVLVVGACGTTGGGGEKKQSSPGFANCEEKPNDCNSGPTKKGGTLTIGLEKTIPNWNIFDSDGNVYDGGQVILHLTPVPYYYLPDNSVQWNKDLFSEEPKVTSQSPQTVQMKIRKEAVWNDGTPITAKDFQYFWKSNNGKDCPDCTPATTTGYEQIKSIEGSDSDKTVTITFDKTYPDWQGLFQLYPSHLAAKQGDLSTPAGLKKAFDWFKDTTPTWSGGWYKIQDYQKDVSVTLVPNDKWYGATKPSLDKVIYRIIEDQAQQVPAMQNKEIQMLQSQPNADLVTKIQGMAGVNYNLAKGTTWEHFDLNLANAALKDVALRQAIFTAVDRKAIIDKTLGYFKGAAPLNSHNLVPGSPEYTDVIGPSGQGAGDVEKAKKILTDAGYKIEGGKLISKAGTPVPSFRFRYTTGNQSRAQIAELFQATMKQLGIDIKIEPTDKLGGTLSKGDYDIIVFAWVNTPFIGDSRSNWRTGLGNNFGKYSNPEVDKLLDEAVQTLDSKKMRQLFNQADEIMTKEAYVLPLFQKPVFLAVYSDYINVRNNSTSMGPSYTGFAWGLKAE
jgi:peptide/nickel transport system substrate-binding protein